MKNSRVITTLFIAALGVIALSQSCSRNKTAPVNYNTSIHKKPDSVYKPGVGEIMNSIIQPHHYKLWLAGAHQNWLLAEYERTQLIGGFKRIIKFHSGTAAAVAVPIVFPALENIKQKILDKDALGFKNAFISLNNSCNECHKVNHYDFIKIIAPKSPAFENQQFEVDGK